MLRLCSLASSSSGNAVLLRGETGAFLMDIGLSYKKLKEYLAELNLKPEELLGLMLTHEHLDHIAGLKVFLHKTAVPVYMTAGTAAAVLKEPEERRKLLEEGRLHVIQAGQSFGLGAFTLTALPVSHDAAEPVCYRIEGEGHRLACVTDLGIAPPALASSLQGLDAVYMEANHDPRMLEMGPYPYPLKLRISGDRGHLSNEACGRLLAAIACPCLHQVLLGHLSKENNYPPLALEAVRTEAEAAGFPDFRSRVQLMAAPQSGLSEEIVLD